MHIKLTRMRISYGAITYVYGKAHMTIVYVILRIEITKLSYIENFML